MVECLKNVSLKVGYHTIKPFYMCLKVAAFYFGVNLQRTMAGVACTNPWKRSHPPFKSSGGADKVFCGKIRIGRFVINLMRFGQSYFSILTNLQI